MNQDPIAALDIGTSRTTLLVGEPVGPGRIRVAAQACIPSSGIRKSRVIDIARAGVSVASVVRQIADQGEYRIGQVVLAVSDPHIVMRKFVTSIPIDGPQVTEEDMTVLAGQSEEAEKSENEHVLLDRTDLCWDVDDLKGISEPLHVHGKNLALHALAIESKSERMADAKAACAQAGIGVADAFFAGNCAALAVLSTADRNAGTLVIDLGGGSTGWTVSHDGRFVHAGVLGVGGEHFTNDIRQAFSVSRAQAEELLHCASAVVAGESTGRIPLEKSLTSVADNSIPRRALDTIVNARAAETLAVIREDLDSVGLLQRLAGGVVLTGGGSALKGIVPLAATILGCPARIGTLVPELEGLGAEAEPMRLATAAGLLLRAQKDVPADEGGFFGNMFGKVFGK